MLKLYLVFPYRGVGGVSMLFLRLAEYLAQHGLAECHLVDYADGFMARNVKDTRVHLECYEDQGKPLDIPADAVALFQSMTPWSIFPGVRLAAQTRVFFWNCYPFNLIPLLPGLRRPMQQHALLARMILATALRGFRGKMRRLVRLMAERRSLVFMDRPNVETTQRYLGVRLEKPVYVPIPVPAGGSLLASPNRDWSAQGLRVVWLGRVVDFKFYILHHSLRALNDLQAQLGLPIKMTLVGSGDYADRLAEAAAALPHIHCDFIEHIAPQALDAFLTDEADLLLAMGTSALEGARLGVPTLLLDVAHGPVGEGYVFRWLYQRSGFTLGDILQPADLIPGNSSLADRINDLIKDFAAQSSMCRQYFETHHELSSVADKLLKELAACQCTYEDLRNQGLLGRGILYTIFAAIRKGLTKS